MRVTRSAAGAAALVAAMGVSGCGSESPPPDATNPADALGASESAYRDGEYSATGWYGGLPSHHDVTLAVENDTVTAVAITTPARDATSLGYQQRFAAALPDAVIGQRIDDLSVDRLAGSSGCSEGFMDALAQIREQAMKGTP